MKRKLLALSLVFALALCTALPASAQTFRDVPPRNWAYQVIERAAANGWVTGYENGIFAPDNNVLYGEFLALISRAFLSDEIAPYLEDSWTYWYDPYCEYAADSGLSWGTTLFTPISLLLYIDWKDAGAEDPISRYDMCRIIYNLAIGDEMADRLDLDTARAKISDFSSIPDSYQVPVAACYALGLVNGDTYGNFLGSNPVLRSHAAAIICRLADAYLGSDSPDTSNPVPDQPATPQTPSVTVPGTSDTLDAYRNEVLRLVNIERANAGVAPLTLDSRICEAAQIRANELPVLFDHTRPDQSRCFTVLDDLGISYWSCAENIAAGQRTPAAVVDSWMHSQGHRENILNPSYGKLGVGYLNYDGDSYHHYWVQLFTD